MRCAARLRGRAQSHPFTSSCARGCDGADAQPYVHQPEYQVVAPQVNGDAGIGDHDVKRRAPPPMRPKLFVCRWSRWCQGPQDIGPSRPLLGGRGVAGAGGANCPTLEGLSRVCCVAASGTLLAWLPAL
jgi:hypothetical protein